MGRVKTFVNGGSLLPGDLNAIQDDYDSRIAALAAQVGANDSGSTDVLAGASLIATDESTTFGTYQLLTTPDQVQNVVVAARSLVIIAFLGLWKNSVAGAARAAYFINSTQVSLPDAVAGTLPQAAVGNTDTSAYGPLVSSPSGLAGQNGAISASVATPLLIGNGDLRGGVSYLQVTPGTYDISVRFKVSSGNVHVKERYLYVWQRRF